MIILITGASHTGKTLLAQKLLAKYRFPYLSMDHVKMGLIRSGKTALTPYDDDRMTEYLWPVIREIIKTAVENEQDLIVEGGYVPADWESGFAPEYRSRIVFICLAMTENYIRSHFDDIEEYASVIERRLNDGDITPGSAIAENARYFRDFGGSDGFTAIDGEYEKTVAGLLASLPE